MTKFSFLSLALAATLLAVSCKKGDTGPEGPEGDKGTTGATGATGPGGKDGTNGANGATGGTGATGATGANGVNGTNGSNGATGAPGTNGTNGKDANVMYSGWLKVKFVPYTVNGKTMDSVKIVVPALTDSMLATSDIRVYFNEWTGNVIGRFQQNIYALPFIKDTANVNAYFSTGLITIDGNVDLSTVTHRPSRNEHYMFRYVIIPGTMRNANINWNNYNEVARYMNIRN